MVQWVPVEIRDQVIGVGISLQTQHQGVSIPCSFRGRSLFRLGWKAQFLSLKYSSARSCIRSSSAEYPIFPANFLMARNLAGEKFARDYVHREAVLGILSVPNMLAETLMFGPNHLEFARRAFSVSGDSPQNVQTDRDILLHQSRGALPCGSCRKRSRVLRWYLPWGKAAVRHQTIPGDACGRWLAQKTYDLGLGTNLTAMAPTETTYKVQRCLWAAARISRSWFWSLGCVSRLVAGPATIRIV